MPGIQELLVIFVVFALLFSSKLPQFGRKIGSSLLQMKKSFKETQEELEALDKKDGDPKKIEKPRS